MVYDKLSYKKIQNNLLYEKILFPVPYNILNNIVNRYKQILHIKSWFPCMDM